MSAETQVREVKKSSRIQISRGMITVLIGTAALFIASALIAPTSVSKVAFMGMIPFAAIKSGLEIGILFTYNQFLLLR